MNWRNLLIAISASLLIAGCSESGMSVKIEQNEHEYAISNDVNSPSLIKLRNDRFKIVTPNLPDKVAIQVCASFDGAPLEAIRKGIDAENHECFLPGTGIAMAENNPKEIGFPLYIYDGAGHNYYSVERRYKESRKVIVNVEKIEFLIKNKSGDIHLVIFIDLNSNQVFDQGELYAARIVLMSKFN